MLLFLGIASLGLVSVCWRSSNAKPKISVERFRHVPDVAKSGLLLAVENIKVFHEPISIQKSFSERNRNNFIACEHAIRFQDLPSEIGRIVGSQNKLNIEHSDAVIGLGWQICEGLEFLKAGSDTGYSGWGPAEIREAVFKPDSDSLFSRSDSFPDSSRQDFLGSAININSTRKQPCSLSIHQGISTFSCSVSGLLANTSLSFDRLQNEIGNDHINRGENSHDPLTVREKWLRFCLGCLLFGFGCWCSDLAALMYFDDRIACLWMPIVGCAFGFLLAGLRLVLLTY